MVFWAKRKEWFIKMTRKYISEFGIRAFSSQVIIFYPNDLQDVKKQYSETKYHIYMINKIKRYKIEKFEIDQVNDRIEIFISEGIANRISIRVVCSLEEIKKALNCNNKNLRGQITENKKYIKFFDKKYNTTLYVNVLSLLRSYGFNPIPLEILYIGQSYGKNGSRDAFERLEDHSTLQKIYADYTSNVNSFDYEIAITLWEFTPFLDMNMDGTSKEQIVSSETDKNHFQKIMQQHNLGMSDQLISVTEAALINYFKPDYNDKFKNNFPNMKHKGYHQYYDLDFNSIMVELDPLCINVDISTKNNKYNYDSAIIYGLDNVEKRQLMYAYNLSKDG